MKQYPQSPYVCPVNLGHDLDRLHVLCMPGPSHVTGNWNKQLKWALHLIPLSRILLIMSYSFVL